MSINDFISNFAQQFDETSLNEFSADTNYRKDIVEWSSLVAFSVIAMIHDEYKVVITGEDLFKNETIQELYELVKTKRNFNV